jgi:hypothetical protein
MIKGANKALQKVLSTFASEHTMKLVDTGQAIQLMDRHSRYGAAIAANKYMKILIKWNLLSYHDHCHAWPKPAHPQAWAHCKASSNSAELPPELMQDESGVCQAFNEVVKVFACIGCSPLHTPGSPGVQSYLNYELPRELPILPFGSSSQICRRRRVPQYHRDIMLPP